MSLIGEVLGTAEEVPGAGIELIQKLTGKSKAGVDELNAQSSAEGLAAGATGTSGSGAAVKHAGSASGTKTGNEAQQTIEGVVTAPEKFAVKVLINGALIIAGLVLVIYGIMVAVRPRESAISLPVPVPV